MKTNGSTRWLSPRLAGFLRHVPAQGLFSAALALSMLGCGTATSAADSAIDRADAGQDAAHGADAGPGFDADQDATTLVDAAEVDAAPVGDAGQSVVQIGALDASSSFVAWHDDDSIPLVRGPQGGVMLTPNLAIDGALVAGDAPMLQITLSNWTLPGPAPLPDFATLGPFSYPFTRIGSQLVSGQLYDQLSWTEAPGQTVILRVHVEGPGLDAVGEVRVVTAPSVAP